MKRLQIVDSTTMTLFSNLIFKGVGRNPRRGKKKGGRVLTLSKFRFGAHTHYVDFYSLFEHPESDWEAIFEPKEIPPEPNLFAWGAY